MPCRASSSLLLLAFPLLTACAAERGSTSSDDSDLIGGREATANEHPATLLIRGNCTATKVGPRHILTAAHCVTGSDAPLFAPGAGIEVSTAKEIRAGSAWQSAVVERAVVDPTWVEHCARESCGGLESSGRNAISDVALVLLRDELVDIPDAAVDLSPVVPGDRVIVTGYGCEDKVGGEWTYDVSRLRVADTEIVPFDRTIHSGSFMFRADRDSGLAKTMDALYAITPGPMELPPSGNAPSEPAGPAGLCPGDSGGPLYRAGSDAVVGVNSNYTFATGKVEVLQDGTERMFRYGGLPVTNWHTRVDGTQGHAIGRWLAGLGVRTTCTRGGC